MAVDADHPRPISPEVERGDDSSDLDQSGAPTEPPTSGEPERAWRELVERARDWRTPLGTRLEMKP